MLQPRLCRSSGPAYCLVLQLCVACSGGQSGAEFMEPADDDPGQDPSGADECERDADCEDRAESRIQSLRSALKHVRQVSGGSCAETSVMTGTQSVSGPACSCDVIGNASSQEDGTDSEGGGTIGIGPVGLGCFVRGRDGSCLYDESEFPGCSSVNDTCVDVCEELNDRYAEDAAQAFDVAVEYASCDDGTCHDVVSIDGQCYADGSHELGRAYDCSLSGAEIVELEQEGSKPPPVVEVVVDTPYLDGTTGFVSLSVQESFYAGFTEGPYFGVSAQFFHTQGTFSEFGDVIDPLEGLDDCGLFAGSGTGTAADTDFFAVDDVAFVDGEAQWPLEEFTGGSDFYSYGLELDSVNAVPRYKGRYGLIASGRELARDIVVENLRLPAALRLQGLEMTRHHERADLQLAWTGTGDAPLDLRIYVTETLGFRIGPFELRCRVEDDGEFTVDKKYFKDAPDGILALHVTRESRHVEGPTDAAMLAIGNVSSSYAFAFGESCAHEDVLTACLVYAERLAEAYQACDVDAPVIPERECPAYLSTLCTGCPEYFECMADSVECSESGSVSLGTCSCP